MKVGVALLFCACALATGCTTMQPIDSGREGLIERISGSARAHSSARGSARGTVESLDAREVTRLRKLALVWPLRQVQVTSGFGKRPTEFHEGVDLRAPRGTSVYAAQAGTVLYAGSRISGYGGLVVVRHAGGVATVYAHNSRIFVRRGQHVMRGQRIALTGASGRAHGPHLHFEVRDGLSAVDPLAVMPAPRAARARGLASFIETGRSR